MSWHTLNRQESEQEDSMRSIAPFLVVLGAGAVATNSMAALENAETSASGNPAVLALLQTAEQDLGAGRPNEAAILLERALRIEPRDATAWHYLGMARLEQGKFAQAEAMAAKSHSLAVDDRSLRARNASLMAAAQHAAGKPVSVPSSEPPPSPLERLFAAEVEPRSTYADTVYEFQRAQGATDRQWPSAGTTAQTGRRVRSDDWRGFDDYVSERVRRERAARRGEPRSVVVFDGRQYRRHELSEVPRRQR
jgi:tetratricopeptide (TPR) repeat protein